MVDTTKAENNNIPPMVCPMCGKNFDDVHTFASHMTQHSNEEKKRKAEAERQRTLEQKRTEKEHLDRLHETYEDALEAYLAAKQKYEKTYNESYFTIDFDRNFDWFDVIRKAVRTLD